MFSEKGFKKLSGIETGHIDGIKEYEDFLKAASTAERPEQDIDAVMAHSKKVLDGGNWIE